MIKYYIEAKRKVLEVIADHIDELGGNDEYIEDLYDNIAEVFDEIDLKIDREE